uniref:Acetyl-coenzyme A carboxylase carboxyl transferase subunit beta, chloroplastic n=1 Tax=Passiflora cerradensis TaxID=1052166 RepID=A0A7H0TWT3_9ROSI|nr:AccD [Passiflora cerradensis]QNR05485.1 AccD [Passiflora cerradensis]
MQRKICDFHFHSPLKRSFRLQRMNLMSSLENELVETAYDGLTSSFLRYLNFGYKKSFVPTSIDNSLSLEIQSESLEERESPEESESLEERESPEESESLEERESPEESESLEERESPEESESDTSGKKTIDYSAFWVQCDDCYGLNYKRLFKFRMNICEYCGCHLILNSSNRIELLIDSGTWDPMGEIPENEGNISVLDPIGWDSDPEPDDQKSNEAKKPEADSELKQKDDSELKQKDDSELKQKDDSELKQKDDSELDELTEFKVKGYEGLTVTGSGNGRRRRICFPFAEYESDDEGFEIYLDPDPNQAPDPKKDDPGEDELDDEKLKSDFYTNPYSDFYADLDSDPDPESEEKKQQEKKQQEIEEEDWEFEWEVEPEEEVEENDKTYMERMFSCQEETELPEAVQTGTGHINGISVAIGVMDFGFIGGSMGYVVGEKITRLVEYATKTDLPLIIVCASGGARMQEGSLSLMQMAKISSALYDYKKNPNSFFLSILTSPTTGGVTASFGMLGDIIIGEPDAYIAFAGKRVIEQLLNIVVPEGSQIAEVLFENGSLDLIVPRNSLKGVLDELLQLHNFRPLNAKLCGVLS